jgi:hypothetical protein
MDTMTCPKCSAPLAKDGASMTCSALLNWFGPGKAPCDYSELRRVFEVPNENLYRLRATIEKLARRAKRIGCAAPTITIGEEFSKLRRNVDTDERYYLAMTRVTVTGVSPRINGWTFGATVDHDGEENVLRGILDGYPAHYREAGPACEHCNTARRRSETFLLRSDKGEWKQVGRSCLKDFLGHEDPSSVAAMAEMLAEATGAAEDCGEGGFGGRGDPAIEDYLAFVACAIRLEGWTSRKSARETMKTPTSDMAVMWMNDKDRTCPRPEDADRATVEAALEWARGIADDGSEFDLNLRAASKRVAVSPKNMGITAYIVAGYLREKTKQDERAARRPSEHVGEVGVRFGSGKGKKAIAPLCLIVERVIPCDGQYGTTYITMMRDAYGNSFKWFASGVCLETGETYNIAGTVKAHDEYKGNKQTVLSRCVATKVETAGSSSSAAASASASDSSDVPF